MSILFLSRERPWLINVRFDLIIDMTHHPGGVPDMLPRNAIRYARKYVRFHDLASALAQISGPILQIVQCEAALRSG